VERVAGLEAVVVVRCGVAVGARVEGAIVGRDGVPDLSLLVPENRVAFVDGDRRGSEREIGDVDVRVRRPSGSPRRDDENEH